MRIQIAEGQRIIAGPVGSARGGDIVDWPEEVAQALVDDGQAVALDAPVVEVPEIEVRVEDAPEAAVQKPKRTRKPRK